MSKRLYPVPDKTRASWCFLVLETEGTDSMPHIIGWKLAVANAHRVVGTAESYSGNSENEEQVLDELCKELQQYQHDNTTLHTIDDRSLQLLRTRLATTELDDTHSLRGFHHVSVRNVLDLFGPWWRVVLETIDEVNDYEMWEEHPIDWKSNSARDLWEIRRHIAPLVPVEAFQGNRL